jgi:autotransporter-associated beta strand protein
MTFTGAVSLTGNRSIGVEATAIVVTFSGVISESGGSRSLSKMGGGTLALTGANTFSGGTTLSNGTLQVGNNNALGTGPVTLSGGTIQATGAAVTLANAVTLGGNVTFGGNLALTFSGAATLSATETLTVTDTVAVTFSGAIGQSKAGNGLTKAGGGTLVLSGTESFTGATTLNTGTLLVNGKLTTSAITVNKTATLGGAGTVGAVSVSGGTISPSAGTGITAILTTSNLALGNTSTFAVALNGTTAGASYDQVAAGGPINLGGSTLTVSPGFTSQIGDTFTILKNNSGSAITGTFKGLAEGAIVTVNGMHFKITYLGGASGHDVVLTHVA